MITTQQQHSTSIDAALVRLFDVLASLAGIAILSPLMAVIAVAIKLDDKGPVFYRALRVGQHGAHFRLYKFRTMYTGADKQGGGITVQGDKRVTRIGQFLRRTKLDELPQLLNVLRGEMSLVGPRPEDPRYVAIYTPEQRRILRARPGITSAASVAYKEESQLLVGDQWETIYRTEVLPAKLAIDEAYLAQRTLLSDIGLILRTIAAILS
jgi:lipopolysaccharide/colanic/teichoic acid biosynthesis glycosyltransferase